jgi:hypothetical protein
MMHRVDGMNAWTMKTANTVILKKGTKVTAPEELPDIDQDF